MKAGVAFLLVVLFCPLSFAKKKWDYDVPCQKVFVTGTQRHEIAWALKGAGLDNNLYTHTCLQPVADAAQATAILDIELDPEAVEGQRQIAARQMRNTSLDSYWVTCRSDKGYSSCIDSTGYAISTTCTASGCATYGGDSVVPLLSDALWNLVILGGDALFNHMYSTMAWGYLFSAKDHRLLWKFEGRSGAWHYDLALYSRCPKKFGTYNQVCKKPTALLE